MQVNFIKFGLFFKKDIEKCFKLALERENLNDTKHFCVNVAIVSEEEIRELNSTFRNVDKVTDVLSFPTVDFEKEDSLDKKNLLKDLDLSTKLFNLGDIAICKQVAKVQAKNYGHSLKREMVFLALHGFLHLLGFDHEKPEDEKEMFAVQDEILNKCGIKR